jgi:eukaryotic-like serine/threonine-protein kinase
MQQVFKAHDASFDRIVALKVPKNTSAERRFGRSARVSARVVHANVAKTLDYFEEDGRPFLVEELILGKDLGRALDEDFLYFDPQLAAHFMHRLAKGVAAAHHADVFHRDLKPSNIMVSDDPNLTVVKITDFGIAKMADRELREAVEGGDSSITGSQTAMGALPYMAPEMIETPKVASRPADVWALGAMLYKLLSGAFPFGSGLRAVPAIVAAKLPPKPPLLDRNAQFGELGNGLWHIVEICLEKDASKRPTADGVVEHCSKLCYSDARRQYGLIETVRPRRGKWGFISDEKDHQIFYHEDSYYGDKPEVGQRVSFAAFPGSPSQRAFPVLPLRALDW